MTQKDDEQNKVCEIDGAVTNLLVTFKQAKQDIEKAMQELKKANQKVQEFYFSEDDE